VGAIIINLVIGVSVYVFGKIWTQLTPSGYKPYILNQQQQQQQQQQNA